jgi:PKHD-type hydroxylase
MNLFYNFWYFQNGLPKSLCNEIIKFAKSKKTATAVTGKYANKKLTKKEKLDLKKTRNSNVVWLNENWIYKEIAPFINTANYNAGWNFEHSIFEEAQFTIYNKNQHYDWHVDAEKVPWPQEKGYLHGKIRKLSCTVLLNDPSEYKGGEFEFDYRNLENKSSNTEIVKELDRQGSIVVFPSFVYHRVKPVTKGTRYSLVIWINGEPFR